MNEEVSLGKYFQPAAIRRSKRDAKKAAEPYCSSEDTPLPGKKILFDYASKQEAKEKLRSVAIAWSNRNEKKVEPIEKMPFQDICAFMTQYTAITRTNGGLNGMLLFYDYDRGIYTSDTTIVDEYLCQLTGYSSPQKLKTVLQTLSGMPEALCPYNPPPFYLKAFGNGIYNNITGEMEPFSPKWTFMGKVATEYHPESIEIDTNLTHGMTFDRMVSEFANEDPRRIRLLHQICKACIMPNNNISAFFIVVGDGGDGKSTFFEEMLGAVVGRENVGTLTLSDLTDDNILIGCLDKQLTIGGDNEDDKFLGGKDVQRIKELASGDAIALNRKYLSAVSVSFSGIFVQLCNTPPHVPNMNDGMKRRVVCVKAENRFVANRTEKKNLKMILKSKRFREHVLASIVALPYYSNYSSVDMSLLVESNSEDDVVGQFIDAMVFAGALDESVTILPRSHIVAAFNDFRTDNFPRLQMNSQTFFNRFKTRIKPYGFVEGNREDRPSFSSPVFKGRYNSKCWGELGKGVEFTKAVEANKRDRYFERAAAVDPKDVPSAFNIMQRNDVECSFFEYGGVSEELLEDMTDAERSAYYEAKARKSQITEVKKKDEAKRKKIPNVIMCVAKNDVNGLKALISQLKKLDMSQEIACISFLADLRTKFEVVAEQLGEPALDALIDNVNSAATIKSSVAAAIEVVDSIIDTVESRRK